MTLDLNDIRVRLDQMAEKIVSGLKDRSRYSLNNGIFNKEKFDNVQSWFQYRLFEEQNLDAKFGRYEFDNQRPLFFPKDAFAKPIIKRTQVLDQLMPAAIDLSQREFDLYYETLFGICKPGEQPEKYGEVTKLDVQNMLTLHERICGMGPYVAAAKLEKDQSLLYNLDLNAGMIGSRLVNIDRENEVIAKGVAIAKRYELPNPESMAEFFRGIIDITLEAEVAYILQAREKIKNLPRTPVGFGQVPRTEGTNAKGWTA
ncbi:MAG: hypothetical protein AABX17_02740 [Nanoarchaeota archaeon]